MGKNLDKYYQTPEWRQKRQKRLKIDNNCCRLCDEDGTNYHLEVHHKPSSYTKIPYESVENDLTTLCKICHDLITSRIRERRYNVKDIEIQNHESNIVERNDSYGMEESEVQLNLRSPNHSPQWRTGESTKSSSSPNEENLWQTIKNASRFRTTRQT